MNTPFILNFEECRLWRSVFIMIFFMLIALPFQVFAQPVMNEQPRLDNNNQFQVHRVFQEADNDEPIPFDEPNMCPPDPPPPEMEFYLAWTNYEIHRVNDDSLIEIILNGRVRTTEDLCWKITTAAQENGGPPRLYFVEDIFNRENGSDIPLNWQIKIKRGGVWSHWHNMTVNPDNSLTYVFPQSDCRYRFRVRIRGNPIYHQGDGHYRLELNQQLIPEL